MLDRLIHCPNCGGEFSSEDTSIRTDETKCISYHRCTNCSTVWQEDMNQMDGFTVDFLDSYEDYEEEEDEFWK